MKNIVLAGLLCAALGAQVSAATPPSNPTWHLIHRSNGMTVYLGPDGNAQQDVLIVYDQMQRDPSSGALYQSSVMHLVIVCRYPGGPAVSDGWDSYYDSSNLDAIHFNSGNPHMVGTSIEPDGPGLKFPPPNSLEALIATTACLKWESEQPAPAPPPTAAQLEQQREAEEAAQSAQRQATALAAERTAERTARQRRAVAWVYQRDKAICLQKLNAHRLPGQDDPEPLCDRSARNNAAANPTMDVFQYCTYMRSSGQPESAIHAACDTTP
jgi:hypothetical protein